jgi:sugar/nucleoside kinase (ribokinase family)
LISLAVATALGKLGVDTLFVGALGRDAEGDRLYDIIKSECCTTTLT